MLTTASLRAIPLLFKLTPRIVRRGRADAPGRPGRRPARLAGLGLESVLVCSRSARAGRRTWGRQRRSFIPGPPHLELDRATSRLAVAGHIASFMNHDYERAHDLVEPRWASIRPRSMPGTSAPSRFAIAGNAKEALRQLDASEDFWQQQQALFYVRTTACIASLLLGGTSGPQRWASRTVKENPNFEAAYRPLIASLGLSGRYEEARHIWRGCASSSRTSASSGSEQLSTFARGRPDHYIEGLRRAGVDD